MKDVKERIIKELVFLALSTVFGVLAPYLAVWLLKLFGGDAVVAELISASGASRTFCFYSAWLAGTVCMYSSLTTSKTVALVVVGGLTLLTFVQWMITSSTIWMVLWIMLLAMEGEKVWGGTKQKAGEEEGTNER